MRIGVDIDDCLFPWSYHAHLACEDAGITNGKAITQWSFEKDYGCSHEALWDAIYAAYDDEMLLNDPLDGVVRALKSLRLAGHTVHIVTARGFEDRGMAKQVREDTIFWLLSSGIEHDSLTFSKDKTVLNLDVAIDDGPRNVAALEAAGVHAYLMDAIHNQGFDHPRRVSTITEFATAILEAEEVAA